MHGIMRRFALPLLALVLLYSCATGRDQPVEEEVPSTDETVTVIDEPVIDESVVEPEPEEVTPEPEPEPEPAPEEEVEVVPVVEEEPPPPDLVLLEPPDLTQLTSMEFFLAAGLKDAAAADIDGSVQSALSAEVPVALEFELISGPIVSGQYDIQDSSTMPGSDRVLTIVLSDLGVAVDLDAAIGADSGDVPENSTIPDRDVLRAAAAITLPPGLVDGEQYSWRARGMLADGRYTDWIETQYTRLNLGLDAPIADGQQPTIDTTPVVTWQDDESISVYRVALLDLADNVLGEVVTAGDSYTVPSPLAPGRYAVRVSGLRADGFATRFGAGATIRILGDASPAGLWPVAGEATLGTSVGLHWSPVRGAVAYQAQYRLLDGEWITLPELPATSAAIPENLLAGETYQWRVRAFDENGTRFSLGSALTFVVSELSLAFSPVIRPGEIATVTRGYADGSRDERPVAEVVLTRPFEMATMPLSNAEAARIVNYALVRGFVFADEDGVYSQDGVPLIGLAVMDYGQQLGLQFIDGELSAVTGYEDHPAVGISWAGAVSLANLLSYAEGKTPAYDTASGEWNQASDGYRLPTEAEWEYAARGSTNRLMPWGSDLSGRLANYYRSFDPFEDVNEPFNAAGGPTTPVDFFDGSSRGGFQTAANVSPFGIMDMVGNTWEWCWDRYDPDYYRVSETTDPVGPDASDLAVSNEAVVLAVTLDPDQRVVRGTAWNSRATDVRLTNRGRFTERGRSYSIGVRLVRAPRD